MNKLMAIASAGILVIWATGCASTGVGEKVAKWQNERPYAEQIKTVRDNGRRLYNGDVELVFTLDDFKKELPESVASLDAVMAVANSALNIAAQVGNTVSPLYVAAVDKVDKKWIMYAGRDLETAAKDSKKDVGAYINSLDKEYQAQAHKDWDAYQKIVNYKPDPAALERGKAVFEKYLNSVTNEAGQVVVDENGKEKKSLDVMAIEMLPYSGKAEDKSAYGDFLVFRENDATAQKFYDDALQIQIQVVMARIQAEMNNLLATAQKLSQDPEVGKLGALNIARTLKGVATGIGKVLGDPLAKLSSAMAGYKLVGEIDELEKNTFNAEKNEADKAKKD